MVKFNTILFAAVAASISFASRAASAVASTILFAIELIGSPFASSPRFAFDGPAAPLSLGEGWSDVRVERHEAGTSRRSAARNV